MADYLTNLASRTLGIAEAVRPRLVSPFEPVCSEETIVDELDSVPARTDSVAESPTSPRDAQRSRPDRWKPAPRPEHVFPPESNELRQRQATLTKQGSLEAVRAKEEASTKSDQPTRNESSETALRPAQQEAQARRAEVERSTRGSHLAMIGQQAGPRRSPVATAMPPEPRRSLVAMTMPPEPRHSAAEPPTVRVTIGRVEVKAPLPPAPPLERKSQTRAPALSLDQYLEQRRSGRR
jgi:hypothetical protein